MKPILLCTLNARYIHSALGLRYLFANMGGLQAQTRILEFTIKQRPVDIAEQLLDLEPAIIGFGCYIWNIRETTEVIALVKTLRPDIRIVIGGPEVSFETQQSPAWPWADHVIRGQADLAFAQLCRQLLDGQQQPAKIIDADAVDPQALDLPYAAYTDTDIRQRVIYVEASRGCPFKCEFCLSALDRTARPFDLAAFLQQMEQLYQLGARHFKFVDRTFNLNSNTSRTILEFFLAKPMHDLFLHFELIPDRLPEALKSLIQRFPPGCLQFEIGIQSFNPQVQRLISRRQDHAKTLANLTWLRKSTGVHLHTDLIAGLPGEDLTSFAQGFNRLVALNPQEIQLGILKRLRGTPIVRHTNEYAMRYSPLPPYEILSTAHMDRQTLFRIKRFARYWDLIANSGRFTHSLPVLLGEDPFAQFMQLSDWLYATTKQTHKIALPRLYKLLHEYNPGANLTRTLDLDFQRSGIKGNFLATIQPGDQVRTVTAASSRQQRHMH